jgi:hypothetical protein
VNDDEKGTKKILRELEKQYRGEEKEIGQNDLDKYLLFFSPIKTDLLS